VKRWTSSRSSRRVRLGRWGRRWGPSWRRCSGSGPDRRGRGRPRRTSWRSPSTSGARKADRAIAHLRAVVEAQPAVLERARSSARCSWRRIAARTVRAEYAERLGAAGAASLGFLCRECGQKLLGARVPCPACYAWDVVARRAPGPRAR